MSATHHWSAGSLRTPLTVLSRARVWTNIMFSDAIDLFKALALAIAGMGVMVRAAVLNAVVLMVFLGFAYSAFFIIREGGVFIGLRAAFVDSTASNAAREAQIKADDMQAELRHVAASDLLIQDGLREILVRAPNAARARVAVFHNGIYGLTGLGMLRFDITHAEASDGVFAGDAVSNAPLSELRDVLPALMEGHCILTDAAPDVLRPLAHASRLTSIRHILSCPAMDVHRRIIGAVFVSWDTDTVPTGATLEGVIRATMTTASQIAALYNARTSPNQPKLPARPLR